MNATRTRRLARGAAQAILAVLVASLCASCARGPQSVSLSLSLTQGMERTIRFVTEQHISGLARSKAGPDVSTVSMVYRFHVTSVDAARTAKLVCTVVDAHSSRRSAVSDAYLKTLTGRSMVMTLDKDGHILALKDDAAQAFTFPGTPFAPGSLAPRVPAQGDLQGLFGGLPGGKVTVGDTWTTTLPSSGDQGIQGTLHWTLASIAGTTARLEYTGPLEQKQVPVPRLPAGRRAMMTGAASGYVLLERETGWPMQGRAVITAEVRVRDAGAPESAATRLVSLSVVTRFEPER